MTWPGYFFDLPNKISGRCVSLCAMRRVQTLLVILALLSAPLSLLARSVSAEMPGCDGMCCLPHRAAHHPANHASVPQNHPLQGETCEHGATQQPANCALNCGHATPDYGFSSPLAPTKASNLASIARLNAPTKGKLPLYAANLTAGFFSTPFQPPRA